MSAAATPATANPALQVAQAAALAPGVDSEDQAALREALRDALGKRADSAAVRTAMAGETGYDTALWVLLTEQMGVAALGIPEEFGGAGASYLETHLAAEELGRVLAPSPFLGSAVLSAYALLASGNTDACERHLGQIAEGVVYALCWAGEHSWFAPAVTADVDKNGKATLRGEAHYVLGGDYAEQLLVLVGEGAEQALYVCDGDADGVRRERQPVMDPTRTLATVSFDGVAAEQITVREGFVQLLNAVAWAAASAEAVGAAKELTGRTVQYTAERKQFGRAIGSFQALKHRMAEMYVRAETASSLSGAAAASVAAALADPTPERIAAAEIDAAAAKARATEALQWIAGESIQLHGGVGITWEYDVHLYFKRAHGLATLFGQPHELIEALEPAAGLA